MDYKCETCEFNSHLFKVLGEEELIKVSSNKKQVRYQKGDIICKSGDPITEFIYLTEGLAKLQKINRNGKEQIVSIAKPFDYIGLLSVFSEENFNYTITAITDSVACRVNLQTMKELTTSNGRFSLEVLKYISLVSDDIIKKTYLINSKNLRGRIAMILLDFSDNIFKEDAFELPISRKEIAEMIDMTPENVIRILSEFKRDDLIEVKGKFVRILDRRMLGKIKDLG